MYDYITMLNSRSCYNTANQLYSNKRKTIVKPVTSQGPQPTLQTAQSKPLTCTDL